MSILLKLRPTLGLRVTRRNLLFFFPPLFMYALRRDKFCFLLGLQIADHFTSFRTD